MKQVRLIILLCFLSFILGGCVIPLLGVTSAYNVATTCSSPTVTLSSSASSIYESASGTLTITATLCSSVSENVIVTIGTSGTSTEGTDYSNVSNITITADGCDQSRTLTLTATANPTLSMAGNLTVEATSVINQDLSSDASPTFTAVSAGTLNSTGDVDVNGNILIQVFLGFQENTYQKK